MLPIERAGMETIGRRLENFYQIRAGPHGSDNRSLELGDFFCILLVSTLAKGAEDEP